MKTDLSLLTVGLLILLAGCTTPSEPAQPQPLSEYEERFQLGRLLFYDSRLSRDGTVSCGSCHQQSFAFTQHGHAVSHGIMDRLGTRNSLPIQNLVSRKAYFWDGGVLDIDLIALGAISDSNELGETTSSILGKLRIVPDYRVRFQRAFADDTITTASFLKALGTFLRELVSRSSRYDSVLAGARAYSLQEERGAQAFSTYCSTCHTGIDLTNDTYQSNGLGSSDVNDVGRYRISLDMNDMYLFRVPSLRNVEKTAPYMHDGRFRSLDAVMAHYRAKFPGLTQDESTDIQAFLRTLTDKQFLTNPRFGESR